jgi:hypothetical protein
MSEFRLNSFLGIDFGTSREVAKEKLMSRAGCIYDEENSKEHVMFFNGLTFAGRTTDFIMLLFANGKFCKSAVYIKPKVSAYAIQDYREIQNELSSKYFTPSDDFELYEEPYYENDGYTEAGISLGKVTFSSYWSFPDANGGQEDFIALKINEDLDIVINYEDGDLSDEMVSNAKQKNSEDY